MQDIFLRENVIERILYQPSHSLRLNEVTLKRSRIRNSTEQITSQKEYNSPAKSFFELHRQIHVLGKQGLPLDRHPRLNDIHIVPRRNEQDYLLPLRLQERNTHLTPPLSEAEKCA